MGLAKDAISFLMQEGLKRPFSGTIITLGKQDAWLTFQDIKDLAKRNAYPIRPIEKIELSDKPEMQSQGMLSDRTVFKLLGFDEIKSLDASTYENADILFDLNQETINPELRESCEVVLDSGTIEHVFHVPNSLRNIFQMLKIGGRVIHISPSSNHIDHGFYMFSPTLFWDYYHANQFDVNLMKIIKYKPQSIFPWKIADYLPGLFNSFSFGGLDDSMYAIACIASKMPNSSYNKIPQQFNYAQNLWNQKGPLPNHSVLKKLIKRSSLLYKASVVLYRIYKTARLRSRFKRFT